MLAEKIKDDAERQIGPLGTDFEYLGTRMKLLGTFSYREANRSGDGIIAHYADVHGVIHELEIPLGCLPCCTPIANS